MSSLLSAFHKGEIEAQGSPGLLNMSVQQTQPWATDSNAKFSLLSVLTFLPLQAKEASMNGLLSISAPFPSLGSPLVSAPRCSRIYVCLQRLK